MFPGRELPPSLPPSLSSSSPDASVFILPARAVHKRRLSLPSCQCGKGCRTVHELPQRILSTRRKGGGGVNCHSYFSNSSKLSLFSSVPENTSLTVLTSAKLGSVHEEELAPCITSKRGQGGATLQARWKRRREGRRRGGCLLREHSKELLLPRESHVLSRDWGTRWRSSSCRGRGVVMGMMTTPPQSHHSSWSSFHLTQIKVNNNYC